MSTRPRHTPAGRRGAAQATGVLRYSITAAWKILAEQVPQAEGGGDGFERRSDSNHETRARGHVRTARPRLTLEPANPA